MEPVQSLISAAVAHLVRPAPLSAEKVLFAWRVAVGPAVSRATRVRLAADGALEVQVDDDRFGDELARSVPTVLRRVQELLGPETVSRIGLRRPVKPAGRRRRAAPRPAGRNTKGESR